MILATFLLFSVASYEQTSDLPETEQQAALTLLKRNMAGYGDRLQDFVCIKLTTRSADLRGTGTQWKDVDKLEEEITYVKHQEKRRLLRVNGSSRNPQGRIKKGYIRMAGEFSALDHVFGPRSKATYEWDGIDETGGRRMCLFKYQVEQKNSTLVFDISGKKTRSAHHGLIHVDCATGAVWRLELESEPNDQTALGVRTDIRYGPAMIGSTEFLLPLTAVNLNRYRNTITRSEVRFEGYHKYEANSSIQFGEEPPK